MCTANVQSSARVLLYNFLAFLIIGPLYGVLLIIQLSRSKGGWRVGIVALVVVYILLEVSQTENQFNF